MKPSRVIELIEKHVDGLLTDVEANELNELLQAHPEARRLFWEHAALHGLMQEAVLLEWVSKVSPTRGKKVLRVPAWRWMSGVALAAAAALVFGFMLLPSQSEQPVAVLEQESGIVWVDSRDAKAVGSELELGTLRLKAGEAVIVFKSGARVVLQGPAEFQLTSRNSGFLRSGKLRAEVPQPAHGFKVGSESLTVIDLGTEFGLAVVSGVSTEVQVFKGNVQVLVNGHADSSLTQGHGLRVESGRVESIKANPLGFMTEADLANPERLAAHLRYAAWYDQSESLKVDPSTLLYFDFESDASSGNLLPNLAAHANSTTDGTIVDCQRAEGRWPGKGALDFDNANSRVSLSLPEPMHQVSVLAWIRSDTQTSPLGSLISNANLSSGAFRFELTSAGHIRIGLGHEVSPTKLFWDAMESTQPIPDGKLSNWVMLVTTFDAGTVHFYCNGEDLGSGRIHNPALPVLGSADIGNLRGETLRNFRGKIDELAVFGRVLGPDEVKAMYEVGTP